MSDYEYDAGVTRLVISEGLDLRDEKHFVVVSAEHLDDMNVAVAVQDEDAPAVALAILEAAGVDAYDTSRPNLSSALVNLQCHEKDRADAERMNTKVRAYIEAQEGCRLNDDYRVKDFDRAEYARVRALILQEEQ